MDKGKVKNWTEGVSLKVEYGVEGFPDIHSSSNGEIVGCEGFWGDFAVCDAYAHEMVNRWNSHDDLVRKNKALREALVKVQQDINWMTNEGKLLQRFVFEYIDDALTQTGETND